MFAVGHLALGYLIAKASSKSLRVEVNLPLVLLLSVLPDIDLILPYFEHRGITHSIIVVTIAFTPVFLYYTRKSLPPFLALAQHILIGDYIVGGHMGTQILWPLTTTYYGLDVVLASQANVTLEIISFSIAIVVLILTKDLRKLLKPQKSSLLLTIPEAAIFGSAVIAGHNPISVELLLPHLIFFAIFGFAILISLKKFAFDRS